MLGFAVLLWNIYTEFKLKPLQSNSKMGVEKPHPRLLGSCASSVYFTKACDVQETFPSAPVSHVNQPMLCVREWMNPWDLVQGGLVYVLKWKSRKWQKSKPLPRAILSFSTHWQIYGRSLKFILKSCCQRTWASKETTRKLDFPWKFPSANMHAGLPETQTTSAYPKT